MHKKGLVVSSLPNAGLGNKLYVWALGQYVALTSNRDFLCFGWTQPKLGPTLRREMSNRLYLSQFRTETLSSYLRFKLLSIYEPTVVDPPLSKLNDISNSIIHFKRPESNLTPRDSFHPFREHRDQLRASLLNQLTINANDCLAETQSPIIGIHVRRGDFGNSSLVTRIDSFCNRLLKVRQALGWEVPAIVYSDGKDNELSELLSMPCVSRAMGNPDIVDLISLSRSLVLIGSRASTFSFWAEFFCDGIVLRDALDPHVPCRPSKVNSRVFEGSVCTDFATSLPHEASESLIGLFRTDEVRRITHRL